MSTEMLVSELVKAHPQRARVLEKFGISYCSSGKSSLQEACSRAGIDVSVVVREIEQCDAGAPADGTDWTQSNLTDLCDHIEATHHAYLREALPRMNGLLEKVVRVHGKSHPELPEVKRIFEAVRAELELHMMKEEQILFPMFRTLEATQALPQFHCGSVNNPISVMEHEHSDAKQGLARIRALTSNYTPPAEACATYCATLAALAEWEADMHVHIAKEDENLFPRGSALEECLRFKTRG